MLSTKVYNKIIRWAIYILTFLMPLFFLPWTNEVLEFNKQALLIFLTTVAFVSWMVKILITGRIKWSTNPLNLPLMIFLGFYGLATLFSQYRYGSLMGFPSHLSEAWINFLCFFALYLVILNNFRVSQIINLFFVSVSSIFLSAVFAIFHLFGLWDLPWNFARIKSFNLVGTLNSLGILSVFGLVLAVGLLFVLRREKRILKIALSLFILTFLFVIILLNFWSLWVCLLVSMTVLLALGMLSQRSGYFDDERGLVGPFKPQLLILPMIFLIAALFFLVIRPVLPLNLNLPFEISPSYQASLDIAFQTLNHKPVFGSGPETFVFDYSKYRSQQINQTTFWNYRFSDTPSQVLTWLSTIGILGVFSFLVFVGIFIWLILRCLLSKSFKESYWSLILIVFSSWLVLLTAFFIYPINMTLNFYFWLAIALSVVLVVKGSKGLERNIIINTGRTFLSDAKRIKAVSKIGRFSRIGTLRFSLSDSPRWGLIIIFIFVIIFGLFLTLFYFGAQRYTAEVYYQKRAKADSLSQASFWLAKAINLNRFQDLYWRDWSQVLISRAENELKKLQGNEKGNQLMDTVRKNVQVWTTNAVNAAKQATEVSSYNVLNWQNRGDIYRRLMGYISGSDEWAIKAYQRAVELEPKNPFLCTQLGLVYRMNADLARKNKDEEKANDYLSKAEENLNKAINLKADYWPAHYQLALVYDRQGRLKQAIAKLESQKPFASNDAGLAFQLGLFYLRDNQKSKAQKELERAVKIYPDYSNALWYLASIYDEKGQKQRAIELLEKVEKLNPENQLVKQTLENIRAGGSMFNPPKPPADQEPLE